MWAGWDGQWAALADWFLCLLSVLQEGESAALGLSKADAEKNKPNPKKNIFLQESEANNFFKRRSKRSYRSRDELNAEHRREYYEEQKNEYENHAEEQHNEHQERIQEHREQWRQWHYNSYYPSYRYRHY
uniref:Unique cartilage matrix-associated protein n=1 Tax=Geotrypetes seraphini TaxID=260995 RepID=A0A6P8S950_GEOSA|nr:unique cartilage matrix-associated protein [Geotrypetes seraphini]